MKNVAIFGVPRSGTSWLGQIFNSSPNVAYRYQPLFAYSFDGKIDINSNTEDIKTFHSKLLQTNDDFVCQNKNLSGNETPDFKKDSITHLVWKEVRYLDVIQNLIRKSDTKVIGIVRHPGGVLHSWQNAPKEFDEHWDILEEWRYAPQKNKNEHHFYGYEQWLKATYKFLKFQDNFPDQFSILTYERLVCNPIKQIKNIFDFVGLPMSSQTKSFLKSSTSTESHDPYGVHRKNKTGYEWTNKLNPAILKEIIYDPRFKKIENHFNWNHLNNT